MPVSYIPSAEQLVERQKVTARKRRKNQNVEIEELGALIPVSEGPGKQALDKISVLRLASTYMRFRKFVESAYSSEGATKPGLMGFSDLLSQAMDGFLLVLDSEGEVLFASKSITQYVGLAQQDVVGQSLFDVTHSDDVKNIKESLKPSGTKANQFRQFYVRFKSTLSPGRSQLTRFTSHIMVQVTGNLKVCIPAAGTESKSEPEVLGLVAECRLIESSPSILEISIPQSSFTSTINLSLNIISVDTRIHDVIGFDSDDVVGTAIDDYFHPADWAKVIPCYKLLLRTGHGISRVFRFLTNTGEWVWIQMDGLVRYKEGTNEPQFAEITCKVVSRLDGKLKFIEQKELYAASKGPDPQQQAFMNIHRDKYFVDQMPTKPCPQTAEPIVAALRQANMSSEAVDSVLHGRELALQALPDRVTNLAKREEVPNYEKMIYEYYNGPLPTRSSTSTSMSPDQTGTSPPSTTSSTSGTFSSPAQLQPLPANSTSQPPSVAVDETSKVPHTDATLSLTRDKMDTGVRQTSTSSSPECGIPSGQSTLSPPLATSNPKGSPTAQSVCGPPSNVTSHLSQDTGFGSSTSIFSPSSTISPLDHRNSPPVSSPEVYTEPHTKAVFSPMPPAFPPATAGNVVMPTVITPGAPTNGRVAVPLSVQQPTVPSSTPQFVMAPYPQPSMFTQPPTVDPSPYQQTKGIDQELDKILCAWEGSPGANSAQYLGYVPQGGYPENANPPYIQAPVAGNTITCMGTASIYTNPPPDSTDSEMQEILQQFT